MWVWLQSSQDDLVEEVTITLNHEVLGKVSHSKGKRGTCLDVYISKRFCNFVAHCGCCHCCSDRRVA